MVFNSVALLAVIAALIFIYLIFLYREWRAADRRRREERLIHRNIVRNCGRQS